jgi:hypothetical protein
LRPVLLDGEDWHACASRHQSSRLSPHPHTTVPPPVPARDHVRRCAPISRRRRPSRAAPRSWARFTSLATYVLLAGDQGDAQACAVPCPPLHPTLHLAGLAPTDELHPKFTCWTASANL